ncbi:MAG: AbrB/MazE/SpoVT family DNA-binding domain-containing protein [Bacilli bacterium]
MKEKLLATAKVGEKGQIVIPRDIREMFDIKSGDTLLVLADKDRGIAIVSNDDYINFANSIFEAQSKENED